MFDHLDAKFLKSRIVVNPFKFKAPTPKNSIVCIQRYNKELYKLVVSQSAHLISFIRKSLLLEDQLGRPTVRPCERPLLVNGNLFEAFLKRVKYRSRSQALGHPDLRPATPFC